MNVPAVELTLANGESLTLSQCLPKGEEILKRPHQLTGLPFS